MKLHQTIIALILAAEMANVYAGAFPYTGTFTDMKCIKSEGDILGAKITIISFQKELLDNLL